jgi:hypothetical protein
MIPRAISSAPRDDRRERSILLYCPDQGGWQAGVWFDGRWTDFATMTVELEPTYWTEAAPDMEAADPEWVLSVV